MRPLLPATHDRRSRPRKQGSSPPQPRSHYPWIVHEAFYLTHQLVEACKVQIMTQSNSRSGYSVVDEQIVEETYRIVQNNYTGNEFGKLEWDAVKRKMESQKGSGYKE